LVNTLSAAAAGTAAAAATTDKLKTAAVVAAIAGTLADYQAIRSHRRSAVEEADRRGRPLADPEPAASPGLQMLRLRH
jgi:hypothetical protein